MSEKLKPRDLSFTKTDKRLLLQYLEKFYLTTLKRWQFEEQTSITRANKTSKANFERRFRVNVKAIEIILHGLDSDFMSNVETPSIRRTTKIAARDSGILQCKRTLTGHFGRIRRKRHSGVYVSSKKG